MSYLSLKQKLDELKNLISKKGILSTEQLNKINHKFRLELNFNSNAMEGNTLTRKETRSVMISAIDVRRKPLKDILEIKGHDEVITKILSVGGGAKRISESFILEIHRGIMHEDDPEKKKQIGIWKTIANEIINTKNEKYLFTLPEFVTHEIHDLLNKTNAAIDKIVLNKKNAPHPVDVALQFHLDFLKIHPFYDGNGRTARILTNLILISFGYPPFWINKAEIEIYYNYITDIQSYGGNQEPFFEFITTLILRSQQLVFDVMEGTNIDDDDDIDKEIMIFKQKISKNTIEVLPKSNQVIKQLYTNSLKDFLYKLDAKLKNFDDLFTSKQYKNTIENGSTYNQEIDYFTNYFDTLEEQNTKKSINELKFEIYYNGFKNNGLNTFGKYFWLYIIFNEFNYKIGVNNNGDDCFLTKLYSEYLTDDEKNVIITKLVQNFMNEIEQSIKM